MVSRARSRVFSTASAIGASLRAYRAELLVSAAFLGGWALVTCAIAALVPPRIPTWELSGGLLLLSLCGWGWLGSVFWSGLYKLSAEDRADG